MTATDCGNCGGELLQVGTSDGFRQDVEQCQACLTVWVTRESGAKDPIQIRDLTVPEVVNGRFGPQFTVAERAVMAVGLEGFLSVTEALVEAGVTGTGVADPDALRELIARLRS